MLTYKKETEIFEAVSEVDGMTVMSFKAEIDRKDPDNSSLDVKKDSESLYRQYRDQASEDRAAFQDDIFELIDLLKCKDQSDMLDREIPNVQKGVDEQIDYSCPGYSGEEEVTDDAEN